VFVGVARSIYMLAPTALASRAYGLVRCSRLRCARCRAAPLQNLTYDHRRPHAKFGPDPIKTVDFAEQWSDTHRKTHNFAFRYTLAPTALDPSLYLALRARLEKYGDDVRHIVPLLCRCAIGLSAENSCLPARPRLPAGVRALGA